MASLLVPVAIIKNVRKHPNADKLEIAEVLGWQMVVPKGQYQDGDKVVYFPADTLLPAVWADQWNVRAYLKGPEKDRVGKVALRGEPSFGLATRPPEGTNWAVGENVAEYFGAKKYDPPVRMQTGDAVPTPAQFESYTDIENMRNYPDVLKAGEEVVAAEKIHGTCSIVGIVDGQEIGASKGVCRKKPDGDLTANIYWSPWAVKGAESLIRSFPDAKQVLLYGEVFGAKIQDLSYGVKSGVQYRAFDLRVDGKFLDFDDLVATCAKHGVEMAPLIYRGPFSIEKCKEISIGKTTVGGENIREGVVVRPVKERRDPVLGRVILKYVGDEYLLRKGAVDYKEE